MKTFKDILLNETRAVIAIPLKHFDKLGKTNDDRINAISKILKSTKFAKSAGADNWFIVDDPNKAINLLKKAGIPVTMRD